jgi:hypothetical protein
MKGISGWEIKVGGLLKIPIWKWAVFAERVKSFFYWVPSLLAPPRAPFLISIQVEWGGGPLPGDSIRVNIIFSPTCLFQRYSVYRLHSDLLSPQWYLPPSRMEPALSYKHTTPFIHQFITTPLYYFKSFYILKVCTFIWVLSTWINSIATVSTIF